MKVSCPVCSDAADFVFEAIVLKKHTARYYSCSNCGYLYASKPFWLEEAYGSAISAADTGLVYRNIKFSTILSNFLFMTGATKANHVDISGGTGLFTRLMRDNGFNYFWSDPYCENIHARGFEYESTASNVDYATAFEVLEHLTNPYELFSTAFNEVKANTLIISTEIFRGSPPPTKEWSYYSLNTGQHIGFFQKKTLEFIAKKLNLFFSSSGNIHIFSKQPINVFLFALVNKRFGVLPASIIRKILGSQIDRDYGLMMEKIK